MLFLGLARHREQRALVVWELLVDEGLALGLALTQDGFSRV